MQTYKVQLSSSRKLDIRANSASDAIQTALERNIGQTVQRCFIGDAFGKVYMEFDVPPHAALTELPAKAAPRSKPTETDVNKAAREKPAPWIEEWLAKKSRR